MVEVRFWCPQHCVTVQPAGGLSPEDQAIPGGPKMRFANVAHTHPAEPVTQEAADWKYACWQDFVPSDLGRTISMAGDTFRILGCRSKAPKRPVLLRSSAGKQVVCTVGPVIAALKKQYGENRG